MNTGRFPSIEFQEISRHNPYWSSWICFCEAIRGKKNLSKRTIQKFFKKLIDEDDYVKNEKTELLNYLYTLSSNSE
jgi:hypothetical protein